MKKRVLSRGLEMALDEIANLKSARDIRKMKHFKPVKVNVFASAEEIKKARKKLHLSQRGFADATGFNLRTLQSWEGKKRFPDAPASKIIRVLIKRPSFIRELRTA
jgi:putative transcriptional regulator